MSLEKPEFDTSVKKIAILANGQAAFITGKGLAVVGTQREIDVTNVTPEEERRLRENLDSIQISQKSDKITLKPGKGRAVVVKDLKRHDA